MATSKIKGLDEQQLEGGGSGGGYRSAVGANEKRLEKRINDMPPKERASLEDVGKQFETLSPVAQRAQAKIDKVNAKRKENEIPEVPMDIKGAVEAAEKYQAKYGPKGHTEGKKAGGAVTASRRADGIAQRGKTKGRMC